MKIKINKCNGAIPLNLNTSSEYEVLDVIDCFNRTLKIKDDSGKDVSIHINNCEILNGGSWKILNTDQKL